MREKLRKILFFMLLFGLMYALSGCGVERGNSEEPTSDDEKEILDEQINAPTNITDEPAEIAIAYPTGSEELLMERFGSQIIKKYPNYTLKFVPRVAEEDSGGYATVLASDQAIDISIMSLNNVGPYLLELGLEQDISDLIEKYDYDLDYLLPNLVDIQRKIANGGIYGLPWTSGANIFLYNKDIFDKFAVPYPEDSMMWDEVYDLARDLTRTEDGVEYQGLVMQFDQLMGLNQLSAPYFNTDHKASFTDEAFARVFQNFARFYEIPGLELSQYSNLVPTNFIEAQTAAMALSTSGYARHAANNLNHWDIASVPVFKEMPNTGFQASPEYFYITSRSQNRDASFQVLAFIASDEYQTWLGSEFALLPVAKDPSQIIETFGASNPGFKGKNVQALIPKEYAATPIVSSFTSIGHRQMIAALNDVLSGIDVNTALREASERADQEVAARLE